MNRSQADDGLLPELGALQHEPALLQHAPRPLPLFLALVADVAKDDPQLARAALLGLRRYAEAPRPRMSLENSRTAAVGGAFLRDLGGEGAPVLLIPSLINPPHILDLDADVSLAGAVAAIGRRVFSLDWGPASERRQLSLGDHVEQLLLPLLRSIGQPPALIGYCLGGTMAIAAANLAPVERVVTLAAPWRFDSYPEHSRRGLVALWAQARAAAEPLGALPMEVLQAAFWSLDPVRTVRKFADFAQLEGEGDDARRFVELEDWANEGEPLPLPAARELIEDLFSKNLPGSGAWAIGGTTISAEVPVPALHLTAEHDRIAPPQTVAPGATAGIASGHVGMIVGSRRHRLHALLADFLNAGCR